MTARSAGRVGTSARRASRLRVASSVIRYYHYDPVQQRLDVQFVSGRRYLYHDVPEQTYSELRRAFSKGEFFNLNIRDRFRYSRTH